MNRIIGLIILSLAILLGACSSEPEGRTIGDNSGTTPDVGVPDADEPDVGEPDADEPDVGEADAEEPDPVCVPETDEAMCARLNYVCGALTAEDNCGVERVIESCGDEAEVCGENQVCGGAGQPGVCACPPESDASLCARFGVECGSLQQRDNCGSIRTVESCGLESEVCGAYETCGGGGRSGVCGCMAESNEEMCERFAVYCGALTEIDNCGVERTIASCGDEAVVCDPFETCGGGGIDGVCGCTPETNEEMCARNGYVCGELDGLDNCGMARVVESCGDEETVCAGAFETCGGGGVDGVCGCTAESDVALCERFEYECGRLEVEDNCGQARVVESCGDAAQVCGAFETCGGGGVAGTCGCIPETNEAMCARLGYECGALDGVDNCGQPRQIASCGDEAEVCDPLYTCGGGGQEGQCGCTAKNDIQLCQEFGYNCGSFETVDSCGRERQIASCGPACTAPETCGGGGEENVCGCTPQTDAELCSALGAECGEISVSDRCGVSRTVNCGFAAEVCTEYDTCGGGGQPNVCGCTPTTCAEQQIMCGPLFDGCGFTLECDAFCVEEIVAGRGHTCAVGSGNLRCWGLNGNGQLGIGNTSNQQNPVTVKDLPPIQSVGPGGRHTCAVTRAGAVYCWGHNNRSQLGEGTTNSTTRPRDQPIATGVKKVVSGEEHSCALYENGSVRCWGAHDYGQVGNSYFTMDGTNIGFPALVDGLSSGVIDIAAGLYHNCALLDTQEVVCWGRNRYGQVGNLELNPLLEIEAYGFNNSDSLDVNTRVVSPVKVEGLFAITQITAGDDYSCALDVNDDVWCWGAMVRPSTTANPCPVDIGGGTTRNGGVCAIFPVEGEGYPVTKHGQTTKTGETCSDENPCVRGVCNNNNRCEWREYPITTVYVDRAALEPIQVVFRNEDIPTEIETKVVEGFAAGSNHLCMVVEEPDDDLTNLMCMGRNHVGQRGDGTNAMRTFPGIVRPDSNGYIVRGTNFAPGADHTCGLVSTSNVKCWGSNATGQIGNSALQRDTTYVPFDVKLEFEP